MPTGRIIFLRPDGKTGYLRLPETKEEFFFRLIEPLTPPLNAGDFVSFEIKDGKQGTVATNVRRQLIA